MIGDYLRLTNGELVRITHSWDDSVQTTVGANHPCSGDMSFFLGETCVSFSGSLAPSISLNDIEYTPEWKDASFWFFHHNEVKAHNAVYFQIPVKVWQVKGPTL